MIVNNTVKYMSLVVIAINIAIADVKAITLMSLLLVDLSTFFLMMILVVIFGTIYKLGIWRWLLKKGDQDEIPFVICLFAVYVVIYNLGGII